MNVFLLPTAWVGAFGKAKGLLLAAVLRAKPSVIIHEHDENSWQRLFTVLSHNKKKLKSHQSTEQWSTIVVLLSG